MGIYVRNRKIGGDIKIPNPNYLDEYLKKVDINDIIQYNITGITSITKTYLNDNDVSFEISPDLSGAESIILSDIVNEYKNKTGKTAIELANYNYETRIAPNLSSEFIFPTILTDAINDVEYANIDARISDVSTAIINVLNSSGYTNLSYVEKRIVSKWLLNTEEQREELLTQNEIDFNNYRLAILLSNDQLANNNIDFINTISGETLNGDFYTGITGNSRFVNNSLLIKDFKTYTGSTENKIDYISGNTINNTDFNQYTGDTQTEFYNYTANTQTELDSKLGTGYTPTWSDISSFSGSSLADIETRNAIDVNYTETNWNINNVNDGLNKVTDYIENTQGSGRIEPEDVLFGLYGTLLSVSGGTGYINYENFHKKITWSGTTFETAGDAEGTYHVYVDSNGVVQVSTTLPDARTNIRLGFYFQGGFIGVIQQCGCIIQSATNRIIDFALRQGIFIYDNGGKIEILEGDTLKISSSPCKTQFGLLSTQLSEVNSNDVSGLTFLNYYISADFGLALDWYFVNFNEGRIPTNRWNDVTKNSYEILSAYTATFTFGSNVVTSNSDLSLLDLENSFIYQSGDTDVYMTPVSGVTWDGSGTTITLEAPYYGTGSSGVIVANYALPKLPAGKYAKHLITRSSDGLMYFVPAQMFYDTEDEAINGVLPAIAESLVEVAIKMAYIVNVSEETDLTGKIYDIRPLPFQFREGGQQGGGTTISSHGDLTGLAADDHLQYLKTDGTRNLTGIQKYSSQPNFSTDLDIISKKYVDDADNLKLDTVIFTGYTGTTNTTINNIENDIVFLSGQTDLKLNISDFNNYTGETQTRFNGIEADIFELSGITSGLTGTYVEISSFTGYTATTDTTLNGLQTQINSLSGVTGLSAVQIRRTTNFSLTTSYQNIPFDVTDVENDPSVLQHDDVNTDRINVNKDGLYLISFDSQAENTVTTDRIDVQIAKNATPTVLNGGDSYVALFQNEIHKISNVILVDLLAGDYVVVQAKTVGTTNIDAPITLKMLLLEGLQGDKGEDGAPGSGSTIKVYEDGVNASPTGGTFQTLNFTTGFSLSGGSTQVNIIGQPPVPPMALLIDSAGGQELNVITPSPINWGTQNIIDTNYFSHTVNNSPITILQDGRYEISYVINVANQTNKSLITGAQIRLNGTTLIGSTLTAAFSDNAVNDDQTNTLPAYPIDLVNGDIVEIVGYRLGDNNSALTKAGASNVLIKFLG